MKSAILLLFLTGCSTLPDSYCKGGYEHTYSSAWGYRQIWNEHGKGVPCKRGE